MNKTTTYVIIAVVVVVVLGGIVWWMQSNNNSVSNQTTQNNTATTTTGNNQDQQTTGTNDTGSSTSTPTGAASLSYTDALRVYANKRIQMDQNCLVFPNYPTYKNGTALMFDNRSGKQRAVAIAGVNYSFKPYSFKIVVVSTSHTLPYTVTVDCGSGENQGRILLQK